MDLVRSINANGSLALRAGVVALVLVSLFAMFSGQTETVRGWSYFPAEEPSAIGILLIGFAIGCYGTIVGIGGGPLVLPVLAFAYGWDSQRLVATSLFVVFLNVFSGTIGYVRQRRIDYEGGIKFALAAIPGAVIAGLIHHAFNIRLFDMIFGTFLILLAVYCWLSMDKLEVKREKADVERPDGARHVNFIDVFGKAFSFHSNDKLGISMNLLLGFFIGFLGIGGGVFQVPILMFLLYYPPHIATATSHFITMLSCGFALVPHLFFGNIHFYEAVWIGLGVVAGAQVGARLAPRIDSKLLVHLFIVIILIFAVKMFV